MGTKPTLVKTRPDPLVHGGYYNLHRLLYRVGTTTHIAPWFNKGPASTVHLFFYVLEQACGLLADLFNSLFITALKGIHILIIKIYKFRVLERI